MGADRKTSTDGLAIEAGHVPSKPKVQEVCDAVVRWRKVYFGRPILQQRWRVLKDGKFVEEWRDVPEATA